MPFTHSLPVLDIFDALSNHLTLYTPLPASHLHEVGHDQLQSLQPMGLSIIDHVHAMHHTQQQHQSCTRATHTEAQQGVRFSAQPATRFLPEAWLHM